MQVIWLFSLGLLLTEIFVFLLWMFYLWKRNSGMLDVAWPFLFILTLTSSIYYGQIEAPYTLLISLLVFTWAGRLMWHLWDRFEIAKEDKRYTDLRKKWGGDPSGFKFIGMFLLQGFLAALLSFPFYVIGSYGQGNISLLSILGFVVSVIGILGEALSDKQMRDFKKNPLNQGKICEEGLWSRSRHPNYFFEWVFWVGVSLFTLPLHLGYLSILSPVLIYILLRYVSGVPMLEKAQLNSKKEAWRDYQKRVPEFFPHF